MGGNPRYQKWNASNWRDVAPTVSDLRRAGWRVYAMCQHCGLQMKVDLERIERSKGAGYDLWGRTVDCKRLHCWGKANFVCRPDRSDEDVVMVRI